MFDKRKEDVIAFVANIEKYIGSYEIAITLVTQKAVIFSGCTTNY